MSNVAYVAFGSNLGSREEHLENARQMLLEHSGIKSIRMSTWFETEPVGSADAPASGGKYLNGVAEVMTVLSPVELLRLCLDCEARLGRVRRCDAPFERNAPRTLDLDVLLFADRVLDLSETDDDPALVVPHPRMLERAFVLEPLVELAADIVHPITLRTIGAHLEEVLSAAAQSEGES
jgi:2-amino-4-hydroxy-6-hydroxymethyldihydropteridine diphosphokinase